MRLDARLLIPLIVGAAAPAVAQEEGLQPGARLRVWHGCEARQEGSRQAGVRCQRDTGTLSSLQGGQLVLALDETERVVAVDDVTRIQISAGRKGAPARGAAYGALAGVAVGMIFGLATCAEADVTQSNPTQCAAVGAAVAVVPAALVGSMVGQAIGKEVWRDIAPERLSVAFGPRVGGGFGLEVSVGF
jgi:hypothetical protein